MARSVAGDEVAAKARAQLADARDAFSTMREDLRDSGRKAQHALRTGLDASQTSMRRAVREANRSMDNARRELSSRVRERPLAYTGGAIAAGLLIGMLLRSLRR